MKYLIILFFIFNSLIVYSNDTIFIRAYNVTTISFNLNIKNFVLGTKDKQIACNKFNSNILLIQAKYPESFQRLISTNLTVFFENDSIKIYDIIYKDTNVNFYSFNIKNSLHSIFYDSFENLRNAEKIQYFNKLKTNLNGFKDVNYNIHLVLKKMYTDGNDIFLSFSIKNNSDLNYNISNLSPLNIVGKATKLYATQEEEIKINWEVYYPVIYPNEEKLLTFKFNRLRLNKGQRLKFLLSEIANIGNRLLTVSLYPNIINNCSFFK